MRGPSPSLPPPPHPCPSPASIPLEPHCRVSGQNGPQISNQLCLLALGCPHLRGAGGPRGSGVRHELSAGFTASASWHRSASPPSRLRGDAPVSGTRWPPPPPHPRSAWCGAPGPHSFSPGAQANQVLGLVPPSLLSVARQRPLRREATLAGRTGRVEAGRFWSLGA